MSTLEFPCRAFEFEVALFLFPTGRQCFVTCPLFAEKKKHLAFNMRRYFAPSPVHSCELFLVPFQVALQAAFGFCQVFFWKLQTHFFSKPLLLSFMHCGEESEQKISHSNEHLFLN
jgi:hypothetical protein